MGLHRRWWRTTMAHKDKTYLIDGYEAGFMGVAMRAGLEIPVAVYDYEICVQVLKDKGMSEDEAIEYIQDNACAWLGAGTPMMVRRMPICEFRDMVEEDRRDGAG
jgi:hypothetical protein